MGLKPVFYRWRKSKRAVALLVVVLAFSPAAQQCHLFCYLGACYAPAASETCDEHVASCEDSCQHGHTCPMTASTGLEQSAQGVRDQHHGCPCPETCWCQQSPAPVELPRGTSVPVDALLQLHADCFATTESVLANDASPLWDWRSNLEETPGSALERCSLLSRFLI